MVSFVCIVSKYYNPICPELPRFPYVFPKLQEELIVQVEQAGAELCLAEAMFLYLSYYPLILELLHTSNILPADLNFGCLD